jgi:hypothetical protein
LKVRIKDKEWRACDWQYVPSINLMNRGRKGYGGMHRTEEEERWRDAQKRKRK